MIVHSIPYEVFIYKYQENQMKISLQVIYTYIRTENRTIFKIDKIDLYHPGVIYKENIL